MNFCFILIYLLFESIDCVFGILLLLSQVLSVHGLDFRESEILLWLEVEILRLRIVWCLHRIVKLVVFLVFIVVVELLLSSFESLLLLLAIIPELVDKQVSLSF